MADKTSETINDDEHLEATAGPAVVVDAEKLFGDRREICIDLEGVRYRLRITRRNKLILQK